ncbi:MAG: tetratricopeptide repeat protein [Candidatus Sumerlaeia bacterium]|nr:tetratricopeptide repeat protein [Candidatus Sumerlaeia bacterium]
MNRLLLFLLFALLPVRLVPAQADDAQAATRLFEQANAHYAAEEFAQAFELYERLYRSGHATREVLFNAGNASHRLGDVGRAVLYYQRALRVDPGYAPARENLDRVQPVTNATGAEGPTEWFARGYRATPALVWLIVAEVAFVWLLVALVLFIRATPATDARSAWGSRSAAAAVLAVLAFGLVLLHQQVQHEAGNAVVVRNKAVTRLGPGEQFYQQLELPAGTVLTTRGTPRAGWVSFVLRDGSSGYIETDDVEPI